MHRTSATSTSSCTSTATHRVTLQAAALLVGERDFSSFGVLQPGDTRSPRKRLHRLEVQRHRAEGPPAGLGPGGALDSEGALVTITAECDRFLMNMMRLLAGATPGLEGGPVARSPCVMGLSREAPGAPELCLARGGPAGGPSGRASCWGGTGKCFQHPGTLVEVGLGRLGVQDVAALLETHSRAALSQHGGPRVYKAPARGLCLDRCFYPGDDDEHDQAWPPAQATGSEGEAETSEGASLAQSEPTTGVVTDHRIKN
jgi:hypothetical protein